MSPLGGLQRRTAMSSASRVITVSIAAGKGIAHPFVGTQALDDGRIEPALSGGNAGNIAHPGLIWLLKEEVSFQKIGGDGMAVPGVGGDFVGPASHRGDPRKPHLPVDTLVGTAEFRLEQVTEIVQAQGEIVSGAVPSISAEAPDSSAPAHRGCGAPGHSSRCVRSSGPGTPAPQGFPGGATSGRSGICPLWFRQDADGFF